MNLKSAAWKRLAAQVREEEPTCYLCGQPIDPDAPARTRWAGSVDHVIPKSKEPELFLVRANVRATHHGCNSGKRDRDIKPQRASRRW